MEALLEHAQWLRRLAASLVAHDGEDLVQDAYVAAMRTPPTGEVKPWLARVVQNAARFRFRSDSNRARREAQVIADDHVPSSDELLERHRLQRKLGELVEQLAEPFRTAILLRFAEGLTPKQIAKREGIPDGTARYRLSEGLSRLRSALDAEHGGNRKKWLLALAPIAWWPRRSAAAPVAAVAVGVAAVAAFVVIPRASTSSRDLGDIESRAAAAHVPSHAASADPISPRFQTQPGAPSRRLSGRVVRDGAPVANALVRVVADGEPDVDLHADAAGRFDLGEQAPRVITVGATAGDALAAIAHIDLRDPTTATQLELVLTDCPARLHGSVRDAVGNPIAHAQLRREDAIGTETGADGSYAMCTLPTAALAGELEVTVRADGYGALVSGIAAAGNVERDFVLAPEATITGTALAGAAIWLEPERTDLAPTTEHAIRQTATADADGRFRFAGASGGRYVVRAAARGQTAVAQRVVVAAGEGTDVALRFAPSATLRGTISIAGTPVAGARVQATTLDNIVLRHDDPTEDAVALGTAVTQADGSFVLDGLPPGNVRIMASTVALPVAMIALAAGDNAHAFEATSLATMRGTVVRHGVPVPFARLSLFTANDRVAVAVDATGHYEARGLRAGSYGFYADDRRRGAYGPSGDPVDVGQGQLVDHDIELPWGAAIAGTVVDAAGHPVAGANVRFDPDANDEQSRCDADATGAFRCARMRGGMRYTATVYPNDNASSPFPLVAPIDAIELAPDGERTGIVLGVDPTTAALAGTVVDETGAPAVDVRVSAYAADHVHYPWSPLPTTRTDAAGRFRFARLAPGSYQVFAVAHDEVHAAETTARTGESPTLALARPRCNAPAYAPAHTPASPIAFDDRIEVVGWDLPATAPVGTPIEVTVVYRVRAPLAHGWRAFAHFDSGAHRANADHALPCDTIAWQVGDLIVDRFPVTFHFAEVYQLSIGFYDRDGTDGPWVDLPPGEVALGSITAR